jgi:hypothetical protein
VKFMEGRVRERRKKQRMTEGKRFMADEEEVTPC